MTSTKRPASARRAPAPPPRRRLVAAGAVLIAVTVVAWALQRGGDNENAALPANDPGVSHVHGLGVDPADGTLFAATHNGLFRIPERGRATRVADRFQDTMGFTVAGPNRFLGSGHPDFSDKEMFVEGRDPHLGLIESTDAGVNWTPLSLLGEADFHGLASAHGLIYGFSATSGEFMVSADTKTWERRSKIGLASFAVDPGDAEHIVGATPDGLITSRDGGRTWSPLSGPRLAELSWHRTGGLWGADPDGVIHRSADAGSTWTEKGRLPGPPEALLVHGTTLYAAASEEGIFRSGDDGRTWQLRYRDP